MPIYEFRCEKCGKITSKILPIKNNVKNVQCMFCTGFSKKIMSKTNFKLKGGGWASSGYSKGGK